MIQCFGCALDHSSALIEFGTPFVIKHIVNIGLDQFQTPLDNDGYI
ncbi:hypothetical protein [Neobacillus ginsengisoli]|uniref:Uncharacterized protein n=1 Tax=Neobacillus ginsengisoli TaxID=904295 RepID=A0ABT9XQ29_9BACI|nr:hypothetical protein [Neobacillus ginsengisoli]MDQ0197650.1 hypothetical protein [Neobacillus ginsengisoli]